MKSFCRGQPVKFMLQGSYFQIVIESYYLKLESEGSFKTEFTTNYKKHSTLKFWEFKLLTCNKEATEQLIY